jgi:hypothetical protein
MVDIKSNKLEDENSENGKYEVDLNDKDIGNDKKMEDEEGLNTIENYKWLYDQKLQNVLRFETRQLQLIGIVGFFIVISDPLTKIDLSLFNNISNFRDMNYLSTVVLLILYLFFMLLLIFYIILSWPRTFNKKENSTDNRLIEGSDQTLFSKFWLENAITKLDKTSKQKASIMRFSNIIFILFLFIFPISLAIR